MNIMKFFRKNRAIAAFMSASLLLEVIFPNTTWALTSGPSQPEVHGFEPVSTSEMVNPFTGSFTYNIPLFELPGPDGGYPFNLAYHSGITMDQEASWVGLGWSLTPGAITRNMRGFPDEFNGDPVTTTTAMRPNHTFGVGAGFRPEIFGADLEKGIEGPLTFNIKAYYNNYRGLGYSIGADVSYSHQAGQNHRTKGIGIGLSLNLDSQEGVSLSPSASLSSSYVESTTAINVGLNYNSRRGLQDLTLGYTIPNETTHSSGRYASHSKFSMPSISFANSTYSPTQSLEMAGTNLSVNVKGGVDVWGSDLMGSVHGYYVTQFVKNNGIAVSKPAYGYLNMHNRTQDALGDYNREKDGAIYKKATNNLAIPSLTYDTYNVTGQGIGGFFRAHRNDIGIIHDPLIESDITGGGVGFEPAAGAGVHTGVDLSINNTHTTSGSWNDENTTKSYYSFVGGKFIKIPGEEDEVLDLNDPTYEPYYFKTYGELTSDPINDLDYIKGKQPVRINLDPREASIDAISVKFDADAQLQDKFGGLKGGISRYNNSKDRKRELRNTVHQRITNGQLLDASNEEILKEYDIHYYSFNPNNEGTESQNLFKNDPTTPLVRDQVFKSHHTAGFTTTNQDGLRYVYGLPVQNKQQISNLFSVKQTKLDVAKVSIPVKNGGIDYKVGQTTKFLNKTELPQFAHSHMLTSVLGADYVDADDTPGPSDGDLGYWVKFEYAKPTSNYKWRAPFIGANYIEGDRTSAADDKASYMYGERENFYLARARTKSHVAVFHMSKRMDARGAKEELGENAKLSNTGNVASMGAYSVKLDKISLYTVGEFKKQNPVPVQEAHFEYDYSLCPSVENNDGTPVDKYGNEYPSSGNVNELKGKLTLKKVWFTHRNNERGELNPYVFDYHEKDEIGNWDHDENPSYSSHAVDRWGSFTRSSDEAKSLVFPYTDQTRDQETIDREMAVWNLKEIQLPSGGKMEVKYEANDYGYVQNKPAMQMTKIVRLGSLGKIDEIESHFDTDIYFDLDEPLATQEQLEEAYHPGKQVLIKALVYLRSPSEEHVTEYLTMYADFDMMGFDTGSKVNGKYTRAFIKLKQQKIKNRDFHPIAFSAWNYLESVRPDLISAKGNIKPAGDNDSNRRKADKVNSSVSIVGDVQRMFKGYYNYADDVKRKWGYKIDLDKSYIRLKNPIQKKYGGGARVKEIVLHDNWSQMTNGEEKGNVYGQVYDYSMEENGKTISSGVATYEPMIGGEENPLRKAEHQFIKRPLITNQRVTFEYPINENFYPAPSIGYRKVRVKSLATHYERPDVVDPYNIPEGISTTGAKEYEFYTAKDFPVITDQTPLDDHPSNLYIPLPLVGGMSYDHYLGTQGYSVQLNDMHGRMKKVSNYRQDNFGKIIEEPISWVKYHYKSKVVKPSDGSDNYFELVNTVDALTDLSNEGADGAELESRLLGQDVDFFVDMRENKVETTKGGANPNVNTLFIPPAFTLTLPIPWPNIEHSLSQTRTAVTNKVIYQHGILGKTEAYDRGSTVTTENKVFDALTGEAVLTSVTNNFGDPVFNYTMPAHLVYEGMGAAYKNTGLKFIGNISSNAVTAENQVYTVIPTNQIDQKKLNHLVEGDEFVVGNFKAIFLAQKDGKAQFYFDKPIQANQNNASFVLNRSGRRNHLSAKMGSVTALNNPLINRDIAPSCDENAKNFPHYLDIPGSKYALKDYVDVECLANDIYNMVNAVKNKGYLGEETYDIRYCNKFSWPIFYHSSSGQIESVKKITAIKLANNIIKFRYNDNDGWNSYIVLNANHDFRDIVPFGFRAFNEGRYDSQGVNHILFEYGIEENGIINYYGRIPLIYLYAYHQIDSEVYRNPIGYEENIPQLPSFSKMNGVLSTSAISYSDVWLRNENLLKGSQEELEDFKEKNDFAKGQRGVWNTKNNYAYVEERKQTNGQISDETPNLKSDGVFDSLTLFNWKNAEMPSCFPKWRKTSTATEYSPHNNALEQKDILGVYSSALYGYKGQLTMATMANSKNAESAYEGFEEYEHEQTITSPTDLTSGNLDLFTATPSGNFSTYETLDIEAANGEILVLNLPYDQNNSLKGKKIKVIGGSQDDVTRKYINGTYTIDRYLPYSSNTHTPGTSVDPSKCFITLSEFPYRLDPNDIHNDQHHWVGQAVLEGTKNPIAEGTDHLSVVEAKTYGIEAHSGKNCLKINGQAVIRQSRLNLQPGDTCVFSAWVRKSAQHVSTYDFNEAIPTYPEVTEFSAPTVRFRFYDEQRNELSGTETAAMLPAGQIINGWQRVESEFVVPQNAHEVGLELNSGFIKIAGVRNPTDDYIDDIRIHPADASMTSYVYDKENYRLKAILDDRNYAMFYYYNDKGELYLVKKETLEGVKTIQESRGHIANQN